MKKILCTICILCFWLITVRAELIITGVFHQGQFNAVELFATEDISDLSQYVLNVYDGDFTANDTSFVFPAIAMRQGNSIFLSNNGTLFRNYFAFQPTISSTVFFMDGNDALEIRKDTAVIDMFGSTPTDGTASQWAYTNGWAYRNRGAEANDGVFLTNNWTLSGVGAVVAETRNQDAFARFPLRSYARLLIDGDRGANDFYGEPLAVQNNPSGFTDNSDPDALLANGSELNAAFARVEGEHLYLLLTGNLESNYNKVEVFIDSEDGGQNRLLANNPVQTSDSALWRMGDDGSGNGLTFDSTFTADHYFGFSGGVLNNAYNLIGYYAPVRNDGSESIFLNGGEGSPQTLANGTIIAINNSNLGGVTDSSVVSPENVETGLELSIPLADMGNPSGEIRICVFVNGEGHSFMSNQVLGGIQSQAFANEPNLGDPRLVDFNQYEGDQFFSLCAGIEGGTILSGNGREEIFSCTKLGDDAFLFPSVSSVTKGAYDFVITDVNDNVVNILPGDSLNIGSLEEGEYRIWGLSYSGEALQTFGSGINQLPLSSGCYELSGNYITLSREPVSNTSIAFASGDSLGVDCGVGDRTYVLNKLPNSLETFRWIVTDANENILAISESDTVNLTSFGDGEFHVWGLSYSGELLAVPTQNVFAGELSDQCFELSQNYLSIIHEPVEAGTIFASVEGTTIRYCGSDGISDEYELFSQDQSSINYNYILTDANDRMIDILPPGTFNPGQFLNDTVRVWGLAWSGNRSIEANAIITESILATGCFDVSENHIEFIKEGLDRMEIQSSRGGASVEICAQDGNPDGIRFFPVVPPLNVSYSFIITNTSNIVVSYLETDSVNFEGSDAGDFRIWGVAYGESLNRVIGDTLGAFSLSDECYSLSTNFIPLTILNIRGGEVQTESGGTNLDLCDKDEDFSSLSIPFPPGISEDNYSFILSDTNNVVLKVSETGIFDKDDLTALAHRIWGLGHSGQVLIQPGESLFLDELASGCYKRSQNYISVQVDTSAACRTVGIDPLQESLGIKLFPVPAQDVLQVEIGNRVRGETLLQLSIHDVSGKSLLYERVPLKLGQGQRIQLPVKELAPGMYFLRLQQEGREEYLRFFKQ